MTLSGNAFPFGLREIKIKSHDATPVTATLPAAQSLKFTERVVSNELKGNDKVVVTVSFVEAVEWEVGAGGISMDAYAIMTGRTLAAAGTGAAETTTMSIKAGDSFPWFTLYGKSMGDAGDDVHVKLGMCKLTGGLDGEFKGGDFYVATLKGTAVDDGTGLIADVVRNETAAALPA
jgi:hypothetical protein